MITTQNPQQRDTWLQCTGSYKCGHNRYICCRHMHITKVFSSAVTGRKYNINKYINCNTLYVVYLITCQVCKLQYVISTKCDLKTRICRHLSDANCAFVQQVSAGSLYCSVIHGCSTSSLSVQGIEKVSHPPRGGDYVRKLRSRETYWIFTLQTCTPKGLNRKSDLDLYY